VFFLGELSDIYCLQAMRASICEIREIKKHTKASGLTFFNLPLTIFENRIYTFEENAMV
jgi:hypothetical protein